MPHVTMKELLSDAMKRNYGVPAFWGGSMEMVLGQIKAAEELGAPFCFCFCRGQYQDMPMEHQVPMNVSFAEKASVPIMTIFDHGTDFDSTIKIMHYGVSSVMYDGSYLPYEENVRNTQEIVRVARILGVSVEAELGAVGGNANEWGRAGEFPSYKSDPDSVLDFITRTNIDSLAISFGNRHGLYKGKADLDFELLRKIRAITDIPLAMHGASDLPDEMYPKIVENGISKVHFWSGPSKLAVENLKEKLSEPTGPDGEPIGYQNVFQYNVDFFYEITKKYLTLLNGAGKFLRSAAL